MPLPKILGTQPVGWGRHAQPYTDFTIFFNAPIDPATVMANLQMTPPLSPTQVYTYGTPMYPGDQMRRPVPPSPSTSASVPSHRPITRGEIGPNIADPYGNVTGQ